MPIYTFPPGAAGGGGAPPTPKAATFVVSPIPGVGDFTTIPAAMAALVAMAPPLGGKIFLREGVYTLPVVLPDLPITFEGVAQEEFAGPAGGSVIDLGLGAFTAFHILPGGSPQQYRFVRVNFRGVGAPGQNVVLDDSGCFIEFDECDFQGIDKCGVSTAPFGTTMSLSGCSSFTMKQLFDGAVPGVSVVEIENSLLFIDGPVAVNARTSVVCDRSFVNTFAVVNPTMELGFGSVFTDSRLLMDLHIPAGVESCRFAGMSLIGKLTIDGNNNNVGGGCSFESVPAGVVISSLRNTLAGIRFVGVPAPITEVGGADFNLYDAINGFAGSTVIGGSSVVGTVIP